MPAVGRKEEEVASELATLQCVRHLRSCCGLPPGHGEGPDPDRVQAHGHLALHPGHVSPGAGVGLLPGPLAARVHGVPGLIRVFWHLPPLPGPHLQDQVFLTSPTEVAKVRLQTQTTQRRPSASWPSAAPPVCPGPGPKYHGPLHCLATVAREEGLRGLYRGSSALLLRDGHSFATYFLSYAILCERLSPAGRSQPDVLGVLLAGGCAGVLAWAVATPMDVIKSRLQADGQGQRRYRGLLHCVVTSVREEGPRVLFKGLALNCCRAFPVNMVVFAAYEAALSLARGLST
ncbi:solute carrier family 25 member 47 isoform X4 [Oryctolagus cuniculus]|uniref:solute carrier family 25 member 47 isoform X4 n=1 Tax=Oryctolagus cuniculus TaxID=9986 RepID=UPI0038791C83